MAAETLYTANTGMATLNTGNSNLDGTGILFTILTAGANGTKVKSLTIKASASTTGQGMIRFYIDKGSGAKLFAEVEVPIVTQASADETFEQYLPLDLDLEAGAILKASTAISNTFNVFAEGLDWQYGSTVRPESTNYTANTGIAVLNTANSNLDGTGTLATVITAGSSATYKGCIIKSIVIKGLTSTTGDGMIRLFIQNSAGAGTRLFTEVPVPIVTATSTVRTFAHQIDFPGDGFNLQAGYKIVASTQNSNAFVVTAEGMDWNYPTGNVLGYNLYAQLSSVAASPADGTTYYFGSNVVATLNTTAGRARIYIPAAGTIDACYLFLTTTGTLGSSETSTISIRLNNTTDTTVSAAVLANEAVTAFSNNGLSIAVVAGDYIEMKWVTPTWATNPTNVCISAQIHIKTNL